MESTVMHVTEVDDANHYGVSNNTALVRLDPNSMLKNVQVRFEEAFQEAKRRVRCSSGDSSGIQFLGGGSSIYTWTGSVLLAINPYQQMNVYDVEYVRYHYSKNLNQADPHPFAIASHAYRQLSKTRVSQSIIISGESGAGKTESSKHVMRFLTMLDETFIKSGPNSNRSRGQGAGGRSTLDDRILGTNPILEAFGNAKTVRNDNSSRFGKLMKLNYTLPTASHNAAKPVIKSASIDTYLLARSRVTHTSSAYERSYHIFYLLCAGVKDVEMRKRLRLEDTAGEYTYLTPCKSKGPAKVRDMDDAVAFAEVVEAFTKLGIPESEQMAIFSVVSAVMKLGNIGLYPDEGNPEGKTRTDDGGRKAAEDVAALIGLDELPEPFIDHLTRQRLVVGGNKDITWADIRSTKASTVRDALAKSLYVKVFDYVVDLLNEKLRGDDQSSCVDDGENVNPNPQSPRAAEERSICILDIFGFENLARNSLEQLCINFANERLNEYFTENVVLSEREEYHQEHIPLPDLTPPDNRPTINVIASLSPPGIFEHLRVVTVDYMIRPLDKDYDAIFMSRLAPVAAINWCKDGSGRGKTRVLKCVGPQHPQLFIVNHYAEPVTYSTEGFIEKNKDCDKNVMDLLSLSNSDFIQKLISGDCHNELPRHDLLAGPSKGMEADSDGEGWKGAEYGTGGRMSIQPASRMSVFGGGRPTARSMSIAGHSRMSVAQCFGGGGGVGPTAASKKCIASEFAKQDEGCSSSKRAHSPALESVPPAKRSRSNSSNDIEKNTPQRGDVPMMAASPLAFTPGRPDRSESRLESAQKARRAARADYTGGDSSAVNRREQMQRRERMQSSAEKEKRLKAMRESARWFEDDNGTSLSPIKRVDEEEDDDRCGDRKSLLDISDKEMYDAKPQTKWETDPSQIVVGESQMIVQRVWNRESRRLRSSEVSIPSMVYSESNLRQPSASLNKGRGARARAASANTSAVSGSGAPNATRIPARAVRTTRAAAAVYERENISGLSAAAASTLNISYGGGGGKGRATRMQPPGVTVKSVARGSAADRARSAPITGVRRAVPKAGPAGGVASQPAGSQSKIGRGNGTLRTAAAAVTSTSLLSNNSCRGRGVASKRP
ncbi:Myosin VIIA [Perkinsus chesapeaki]|uniref:Myosin VIIA n=1 Tax=Perkinsus chesapeaki TaxID=330153 RepID=A0A7J6MYB2_PERCH|nr:Myosin VIIA [Perkinsus chesapeaki]